MIVLFTYRGVAERRDHHMNNKAPYFVNTANITKVGNECIILPTVLSDDCTVGLANETAVFILNKIDGVNTIKEIANSICDVYEVEFDEACVYIENFLEELVAEGVCGWKEVH